MGPLSTVTIERRQPALALHRDMIDIRGGEAASIWFEMVDQGIHLGHPVTAHSLRSCDLLLKATPWRHDRGRIVS
jgi:hypothetical protein